MSSADFPVLTVGPTPHRRVEEWTLRIDGAVEHPHEWTWEEFQSLPSQRFKTDIHCVTSWSKLDTVWEGVSLDVLLDGLQVPGRYVRAVCDGGYETNLPLSDITGGKAWIAYAYDDRPLAPEHGGPAAPAGAPLVLVEERQVGARADPERGRSPWVLGNAWIPPSRRSVARGALPR